MKSLSLVKEAHLLVKNQLHAGAVAIDATVGNGHDTLFLANQVTATGKVFGFDIQPSALNITRSRLEQANQSESVTLFQANHAAMTEKIPVQYHGRICAVMFNLGYLPGGDKGVITLPQSTLLALTGASQLLSVGGIATVLAYPGHCGGANETDQVRIWCERLNSQKFTARIYAAAHATTSAPVLFAIYKTA